HLLCGPAARPPGPQGSATMPHPSDAGTNTKSGTTTPASAATHLTRFPMLIHRRISHSRRLKPRPPQPARITPPTRPPRPLHLVARHGKPVVPPKPHPFPNNLRLGKPDQRRMNMARMPLHPRLGGKGSEPLISRHKFGPTIRVSREVHSIYANEN